MVYTIARTFKNSSIICSTVVNGAKNYKLTFIKRADLTAVVIDTTAVAQHVTCGR